MLAVTPNEVIRPNQGFISMQRGTVQVQGDHLQKITSTRNPLKALEELIWNGLDADADEIFVQFEEGELARLGGIRIIDHGTGIPYSEALHLFESLGGSWKARQEKTKKGRYIHGKNGQGRFKAFALGKRVSWETTCLHEGEKVSFTITANSSDLRSFEVSDPIPSAQRTGTTCLIEDIHRDYEVWANEEVIDAVTEDFAPYLYEHRRVKLVYDGVSIDPASVIAHHETMPVSALDAQGEALTGSLTAIEWKTRAKRTLYLCTSKTFPIHKVQPKIRARGFTFTAYLSATYFDAFADENNASLLDLDTDALKLMDAARECLRDHFRTREAELARDRVAEWKDQRIYPFSGEAADPIEQSERQIFDVLAVNLVDHSKEIDESGPEAKKVTFGLLKAAIESGPSAVRKIFQEVLQLPVELQEDLSQLLEHTTLSALIGASREIIDRLDFLASLQMLIFDPQSKRQLLERSQLHKILEQRTWLFGEEFHLSLSDQGLSAVLDKHLRLLGRAERSPEPVLREDGTVGIVDLMLSRLIPQNRGDQREHLIIELKRPSQPITNEIAGQLLSYARAVAADERFVETNTSWSFWAISNEIDDVASGLANQENRPPGLYYFQPTSPNIKVWLKTWGQIIQECEGRHKFVRDRLDYTATDESALAHLRQMHEKYLPPVFKRDDKGV